MPPIPLYLKTDEEMPRPSDPEFYWVTRSGTFLCRNHPFFASDVPARRPPKALAPHTAGCVVRYPRVKASTLEYVVAFFGRVYELHQSEAVVLLLWDLAGQRYKVCVPPQRATVLRTWGGGRSPWDVSYMVPVLPAQHLLVGDLHSHGNLSAFSSGTDRADEVFRDGIHGVVGCVHREPPEFHLELAIDGHRFALEPEQVFEGYGQRRRFVPRRWLEQVTVQVEGKGAWGYARREQREWS
jgi:hypothetical protein